MGAVAPSKASTAPSIRRRAWDAAGGVPRSRATVDYLRGVRRHSPRDLPPGLFPYALTGAGSGSGSPARRRLPLNL
ncbi:hypothetical protein VPH35_084160 [Triticum aestivum]|uniref:Uncharacterized protein n=1 Tax=Triticum urartu TaxID=4572 RepID=A0A8R7QGK3_TRIUA